MYVRDEKRQDIFYSLMTGTDTVSYTHLEIAGADISVAGELLAVLSATADEGYLGMHFQSSSPHALSDKIDPPPCIYPPDILLPVSSPDPSEGLSLCRKCTRSYPPPVSYTHLDVYKRQALHFIVSC